MKHNVYDFDKTIYKDDSSVDFYLFCLKRHPDILREIPMLIGNGILYLLGQRSKTTFKENFYRYLRHLDSIDDLITRFWSAKQSKIQDFYIEQHSNNDIIISASPEFLLKPICKSLNIDNLIASKVNKRTGLYDGENCWGEEKLRRFKEEMPGAEIKEFYSDSLSDAPLAEIAEKAFVVRKDEIILWSDYRPSFLDKMKVL